MKLKNKLLPFIGIAATVATATPLALTSCKSNSADVELIDLTDGTKAIPTIDPMQSTTWMTQTQYTTAYIKAVKENPDIFKQDFLYGQYYSRIISTGIPETVKVNYLKVGISTPTFGVTNISYPGEPDVQYPTISFTYKIQYSYDDQMGGTERYEYDSIVKNVDVTVKDMPLIINGYTWTDDGVTKTNYWVNIPGAEYQYIWKFNLNPWSINYSYSIDKTITTLSSSGKVVSEDHQSDAGTIQSYSEMMSAGEAISEITFGFNSHYLSAITMAPEFTAHEMYTGTALAPIEGTAGSLTAGISTIPHTYMRGLYISVNDSSRIVENEDLSVSVFAGYDADGETKLPIMLEQILPETSTTDPVYIKLPTTAQKYYDQTKGDGWAAQRTVQYDGAEYEAYQFPEGSFVKADGTTASPLMPLDSTQSEVSHTESFTFMLPKSIMVQFSYYSELLEKDVTWDQEVWLNQDEMTLYAYFEKAA